MKKTIFLFVLFMTLVNNLLNAQTPQYALSGGVSNNTIPLMSATNRAQWVYYRSDFSGLPTGNLLITKIYLRSGSTSATTTFNNLTIRMGHTTLNTFSSGAFATGLTTVFSSTSHTVTSITAGGWVEFTLHSPFTYNGTQNIILEVSQTGYTGGFTVRQNTLGGNRRLFGTVASTTGTASTGIADFGIDTYPIHPCTKPTLLPAIDINSNSARVRWNTVTGGLSYDYRISTSPVWPTSGWINTVTNTAFITGLTPSTRYFLLVRSRCSATTFSFWDTVSFRTLPPCSTPNNFKVVRLDSNSADISWARVPTAQRNEYIVDMTRATPLSSEHIAAVQTTDTFAKIINLLDATKYYVHIRSKCAGNDSSTWSLDSFRTPLACKSVQLEAQIISKSSAILHWDSIKTGYQYEYYNSFTPDKPAIGTPIKTNFIQLTTLQQGMIYYMHTRSLCLDNNVYASSPWATIAYSTSSLDLINKKNEAQKQYILYPNPVQNTLYIENKTGRLLPINAKIFDVLGRLVKTFEIKGNTTTIDLQNLNQGKYTVMIYDLMQPIALHFIKE